MTTTPEQRTATLTELVAQEIDAVRGRRRMSQAQLARAMGKTPMWVSLRLRGLQPIDVNDLLLFARALDVGVHDLMPPPETAAQASVSVRNPILPDWPLPGRRRRTRGREDTPATRPDDRRPPAGPRRTARLPRPEAA